MVCRCSLYSRQKYYHYLPLKNEALISMICSNCRHNIQTLTSNNLNNVVDNSTVTIIQILKTYEGRSKFCNSVWQIKCRQILVITNVTYTYELCCVKIRERTIRARTDTIRYEYSSISADTTVADTIRYDTPSIGTDTIPIR